MKPPKRFGITPFPSLGINLFVKERALQKGHFCSFAEKGRGLNPQDLSNCVPAQLMVSQG